MTQSRLTELMTGKRKSTREEIRSVAARLVRSVRHDDTVSRLGQFDALNEYTETKSVFVELSGGTRDPFQLG